MNKPREDITSKILEDADFINLPKYNNSLQQLLDENPNGVSDSTICKALGLSQSELEERLKSAIMKLQESVGVNNDE